MCCRYIGFTMYSTCIVWLAFIPIFFGTHHDYQVSNTTFQYITELFGFFVPIFFGTHHTYQVYNTTFRYTTGLSGMFTTTIRYITQCSDI